MDKIHRCTNDKCKPFNRLAWNAFEASLQINKVATFFSKASLVALEALFSCLCMYVHVQLHFSQHAENSGTSFFQDRVAVSEAAPGCFLHAEKKGELSGCA